ncbi:MAG: GNAT family N-acetyltransferase [Planctomycetota bacterium]
MISIPYDIGSGGALANDDRSERALVERAMELAKELRVAYLELRYGSQRQALADLEFRKSKPVLISDMELDDKARVWARVQNDHRKAIRKAKNRGVTVREAVSIEDFSEFYPVYLRVFRNFGTPPYGTNYFPVLWRRLQVSGAVRLLLAHAGQRCIGGLLLFCWGRNLISKFAACLPEAVPLRVYAALYWRAIEIGLELDYERLSWGTSSRDQTGLIEFKERWGAQSRPAVLHSLPVQGNVPSIEKYYNSEGFARQLWKKLPICVTPFLGGQLNRWFC